MTSYPAMIARELGCPMVGGVAQDAADGTDVTVDSDRGVVYETDIDER